MENKADLLDDEKKDDPELNEFANKNGFDGAFRTSAKTGLNINESMTFLISNIIKRMERINIDIKKEMTSSDTSGNKHIEVKSDINFENKILREELDKYKKENEEMKNKINLLTDENIKLKDDLINANKTISNFNNDQLNNIIFSLNEIIKSKDKEINNLKLQNNKTGPINFEDIIVVQFTLPEQKINCPIKCLKTDTFAEVEERLYQKYEEFRETNNNFNFKGGNILRFKKIGENNIQDGDEIQLLKVEQTPEN